MTKIIQTSEIIILPTRQRRSFDEAAHRELVESIETKGLLHAIVLRFDDETQKHILVAGERRLRAVEDIYALGGHFIYDSNLFTCGVIPFVLLSDLSPVDFEEAELEENLRRVNLTWQEEAAAKARLLELRNVKAPTTAEDLLKEVGGDPIHLRDSIRVAKNLSDPEIAKAASLKEAVKVLARKEEKRRNAERAERFSATESSHVLLLGDSLELMKGLPEGSFDVILTDPPYGMGADTFGDCGNGLTQEHGYDDSIAALHTIIESCPRQLYRLAKPEAHLYVFCDIFWFNDWKDALSEEGWKVFRTPLIWYKRSGFRSPWPDQGPQRKYECILYAVKGDKKVLKVDGDVIDVTTNATTFTSNHPAEKPVEVYTNLLSRSARPGDHLFDPFMGSGTIIEAAHLAKCKATGIEMSKEYFGAAVKRQEGLK